MQSRGRVWLEHTDVVALNGGLRGLEPQTNVLVPSPAALARPGGLDLDLGVEEDCKMPSSSASVFIVESFLRKRPKKQPRGETHCAAA